MEPASVIAVELGPASYEIVIGPGVMRRPDSYRGLGGEGGALIVTNRTVGPLYGEVLADALRNTFGKVEHLELPDGEAHKDWQTLNRVFDHLLRAGYDRQATLFALGGGVVGDITGFAAACYMRGVHYVQVPTTLLAQVDSSVGGKTGINHPAGKNMVGAFHQPRRVVADLETLRTLPRRELAAGLAEVVKYGAIADPQFLGWLEAHLESLLACDDDALAVAVARSCAIKASIVSRDERESGLRAILNFGHTFGHAIEALLGFGTWLHGEAVGCGMVLAAQLSVRLGSLDAADAKRLEDLVTRAGLPVRCPSLPVRAYLDAMRHDKKSAGGRSRFVVLEGLGRARLQGVDDDLVTVVLEERMA